MLVIPPLEIAGGAGLAQPHPPHPPLCIWEQRDSAMRNFPAKAVRSPRFRPRVVKSKKHYSRKGRRAISQKRAGIGAGFD